LDLLFSMSLLRCSSCVSMDMLPWLGGVWENVLIVPFGELEKLSEEVRRFEGRSGEPTWPKEDGNAVSDSALLTGRGAQMELYREGLPE